MNQEYLNQDNMDFDALGLTSVRRRNLMRLGPVDMGSSLITGTMNNAFNQMPTGNFILDLSAAPFAADYFGGISVTVTQGDVEAPRFSGSVVSAKPDGESVAVQAIGSVAISESVIPGMAQRGVPPQEAIYVMARSIGMPDERLRIDGLDALPMETFEVLIPIDGIVVGRALRFSGVTLIPASAVTGFVEPFNVTGLLKETFAASTYALVLVTASLMYEAEARGTEAVDVLIAWLTTQLRCGLIRHPNGVPIAFERKEALAEIKRKDAISVRGLLTLRQWIRIPQMAKQVRFIELTETLRSISSDLPELTLQERLALKALSRAALDRDGLAQVQAMWEAIEFYVSGTEAEKIFQKSEMKAIREVVIDAFPDLSEKQGDRFMDLMGRLNDAPLLARLRKQLDIDRVPIDEGEVEILVKLRKLRNDVVHGRQSVLPAAEDVEYGISIVARMLLFRLALNGIPADSSELV